MLEELQNNLKAIGGQWRLSPVGLSVESIRKIEGLKARGYDVLQPMPASEQALSLAMQELASGHPQRAMQILAQDIGHQMAMRYANAHVHIHTGALARELSLCTWSFTR